MHFHQDCNLPFIEHLVVKWLKMLISVRHLSPWDMAMTMLLVVVVVLSRKQRPHLYDSTLWTRSPLPPAAVKSEQGKKHLKLKLELSRSNMIAHCTARKAEVECQTDTAGDRRARIKILNFFQLQKRASFPSPTIFLLHLRFYFVGCFLYTLPGLLAYCVFLHCFL